LLSLPMSLPSPSQPTRKSILFVDDEGMRDAIYGVFPPQHGVDGYSKATESPTPDLIIADVAKHATARRYRHGAAPAAERRPPPSADIFLAGQMSAASFTSGLSFSGLSLGLPFASLPKSINPSVSRDESKACAGRRMSWTKPMPPSQFAVSSFAIRA
jgi:hypothetical protein